MSDNRTCRQCGTHLSVSEERFGICACCYGRRAMQQDRNRTQYAAYGSRDERKKRRFVY